MGFCDLDQQGMLIEGFDYDGIFITINNAPYYKEHMERLGLKAQVSVTDEAEYAMAFVVIEQAND